MEGLYIQGAYKGNKKNISKQATAVLIEICF